MELLETLRDLRAGVQRSDSFRAAGPVGYWFQSSTGDVLVLWFRSLGRDVVLARSSGDRELRARGLSTGEFLRETSVGDDRTIAIDSIVYKLDLDHIVQAILCLPGRLSTIRSQEVSSLLLGESFEARSEETFLRIVQ